MSDKVLIRDVFNPSVVRQMGANLKKASPNFKEHDFVTTILNQLPPLSFKERNALISNELKQYLPEKFNEAANVILASFSFVKGEGSWSSFYYMPFGTFVAEKGCSKENFDLSMKLLYEITQRFTSEFAIRPFYLKFPEETYQTLASWRIDKNEHVRRFVSEGSRPRLPWAPKIDQFIKNPDPLFELLTPLMDDSSLYVRKSVANHLNDIAKDHPEKLLNFLYLFKNKTSPKTKWIIKQALRTLIKKGNPKALELVGISTAENIEIKNFKINAVHLKMGEELSFDFEVFNGGKKEVKVMIDYLIYHQKANGSLIPKVFKLSEKKLAANEGLKILKKHTFKELSTRKYYPGLHAVQLQINGALFDKIDFHLNF